MSTIRDDVRMAIRKLRQQPGFAAVAIATLALGLGANIAIFTLLHALLLRTLPVDRPDQLYRLGDNNNCCVNSGLQGDYSLFSFPLFEHLRTETPGFVALAGFQANTQPIGVRRAGDRAATSIPSQYVTSNYFEMFGVTPAAGRLLRPDDDRADAPPVVVISHRTWRQSFGEDRSLVGGSILVNGRPMTVAGITAVGFFGDTIRPDPTGIWIPARPGAGQARPGQARPGHVLEDRRWTAQRRLLSHRDPQPRRIRPDGVAEEAFGGDAGQRHRPAVDDERGAHDRAIAAEVAHPDAVAHHDDRRGIGPVIVRTQQPACGGHHAEHREVVAGDVLARVRRRDSITRRRTPIGCVFDWNPASSVNPGISRSRCRNRGYENNEKSFCRPLLLQQLSLSPRR